MNQEGKIILYTIENTKVIISVRFMDETFWMTQKAFPVLPCPLPTTHQRGCLGDNSAAATVTYHRRLNCLPAARRLGDNGAASAVTYYRWLKCLRRHAGRRCRPGGDVSFYRNTLQ
jgi:hypothetical protein